MKDSSIFGITFVLLLVVVGAASCGAGRSVPDTGGLRVALDSANHVACYHWSGQDNNISCVRIDK